MQEGVDFRFRQDLLVEESEENQLPIELLVDEFKGVVYTYKDMILSDNDDGSGNLQFNYEIFEDLTPSVDKNPRFEKYIGLVLNQMIITLLEDIDANRVDNTKEPDSE